MSSRDFHQRKTYRCPIDPRQTAAELAVGKRRVPVRLYNTSSGGFAALAEGDPGVTLGQMIGLRTGSGTFEVRVAHVGPLTAAPGEAPGAPASYRLGLERLRDLASLDELYSPACAAVAKGRRFRFLPSTAVGTAAVVLLLAAVAMSGTSMWCAAQVPVALTAGNVLPAPPAALLPGTPAAPGDADATGLTAAQRARLRDVATAAARMLCDIDAQWQGDPPADRHCKQEALLDALQREIFRALPQERPARWQRSVPEP